MPIPGIMSNIERLAVGESLIPAANPHELAAVLRYVGSQPGFTFNGANDLVYRCFWGLTTGSLSLEELAIPISPPVQSWDEGAEQFASEAAEEHDVFKRLVDTPRFLSMIGDVKDRRVLDIGCGNGDLCRRLGERGADVFGIDSSPHMIARARRTYPYAEYLVGDVTHGELPLPDESVDIVTAKMLLMYVQPEDVARKAHRVLKKDGLFAVDIVHPFRHMLKTISGQPSRYSTVHNYFTEQLGYIKFAEHAYPFYFRSLDMYLNKIMKPGFQLQYIEEVGVDADFVTRYPREMSKLNTPVTLHMLFRK